MTTGIRKRGSVLRNMKYDRVDLVKEGANGKAHILIAKNRAGRRKTVVTKTMATYQCADCEHTHSSVKKSLKCEECGSKNLNYTEVQVTKSTAPLTKKTPKNDDSTNAGQYTFEDEQYDQDNGENGEALGTAVEPAVQATVNKGWFEVEKASLTHQNKKGDGGDVDTVDNEKNEEERERPDSDKDQELLAMTLPVGKRRTLKKEKPGLNSYDLNDQGSQTLAEDAELMYRSAHEMDPESQERRSSTMDDVFNTGVAKKARRKTNHEGLSILENGNAGINAARGVRRNGTNTGSKKPTTAGRTAVSPPGNPLDKSRKFVLKKSAEADHAVPTLEALNLCVRLAENVGLVLKSGKGPELYETAVEKFLESFNAAAETWFNGETVTKSANADAQAQDVSNRAWSIISKAMSEDCDDDDDSDDGDKGSDKLKNMKGDDKVGKNKVNKSAEADGNPYAGVPAAVQKRLQRLDELEELQTQAKYDEMASELRYLPGFNQELIAKNLRNAFEVSEENGEYVYEMLAASSNSQKDSAIFKQLGMPGAGSVGDNDPMARAYAYADTKISKSGDGPTREQLVAEYIRDHGADFYSIAQK